jgi:succinate-acetate transporter protein
MEDFSWWLVNSIFTLILWLTLEESGRRFSLVFWILFFSFLVFSIFNSGENDG